MAELPGELRSLRRVHGSESWLRPAESRGGSRRQGRGRQAGSRTHREWAARAEIPHHSARSRQGRRPRMEGLGEAGGGQSRSVLWRSGVMSPGRSGRKGCWRGRPKGSVGLCLPRPEPVTGYPSRRTLPPPRTVGTVAPRHGACRATPAWTRRLPVSAQADEDLIHAVPQKWRSDRPAPRRAKHRGFHPGTQPQRRRQGC